MRHFARLAVVFGSVVGLSSALGVIAIGCSGDDTIVPLDSSADTTTDVNSNPDTGGHDGGGDSPSEAGNDAGDVNQPDVNVPPLDTFIETVAAAYCDRLGECCVPGKPASWDRPRCINVALSVTGNPKGLGFHNAATKDAGATVTLDTAKAKQCLILVRGMNCTINSADYNAIRDACYGALQGNVALNAPGCRDSIQCASPGRCDTTVDGGQCVPLLGDGGLCTTSDDCSYRGTYQPALFCDDDATRHPDDAGGSIPTCSSQLPLNGTCGGDTDFEGACTTGICAGLGTCENSLVQNDVNDCDPFTIKDAGGGG